LVPITIGDDNIEVVSSFHYLGSVVECDGGGVKEELAVRVSHIAAVFGALHESVFMIVLLSILTNSIVYKAVVLGVLLYAEMFTMFNEQVAW